MTAPNGVSGQRVVSGLTANSRPCGPIRLLHVFPTFANGGVPLRIVDVANRLPAGYHHSCIALDGRVDAAERLDPETPWRFIEPGARNGSWPREIAEAKRILLRETPDVLCTYNWGAIDWAFANSWLCRRPHLHFESGFGPEEASGTLRRRDLFRRLALVRTSAVIVPSHTLAELASSKRWMEGSRVRLLPNGVDCGWYAPDQSAHDDVSKINDPLTVATVAPLRREKRLDRLIGAFANVADRSTHLMIAGDGPCRGELERLAHRLDVADQVTFLGHLGDVRPVLHRCRAFAMTSETEQMPNALLQAMAAGCAVVAQDAGDIARILPADQGDFVVPQNDLARFSARLGDLLADRDLAIRLGVANQRRARESYDMAGMVAAYDAVYREMVEVTA